MARQYYSARNLRFLLHEVYDVEQLTKYPYYAEHNRESLDMIVDAASKFAEAHMRPMVHEMDQKEAELEHGNVHVHPNVPSMMRAMGRDGWLTGYVPFEQGGMQLPNLVTSATIFIYSAANKAASMFPGLSMGAARLILNFGNQELKDTYLPHMFDGSWQGTMALTEPQAGSSLSDLTTTAEPQPDGSYLIKGQKIFISAGDYEGADNIVHLLLARIKGAPAGVKGISLFVVPKLRPENGHLVPNDVKNAGIYHKMGERGCPAMHLAYGDSGDCKGWLVGEPNNGLGYMFQMMNEARLGVGIGAAGVASAAYYASLEYANERPQGRKPTNRDATTPQLTIIEHADVRRMLLAQKAIVEGAAALLMQISLYADIAHVAEGDEKNRAHLLLDLLTPIAKSFPSEKGIESISNAMQVFGGYGFTRDFPVEQYLRDVRISAIYEGTTGIQAQDLLGRKVTMKNGQALIFFGEEVTKTIQTALAVPALKAYAEQLAGAAGKLQETTMQLAGLAMQGKVEEFLADANLYLEAFSTVTIAWVWLQQALVAQAALDAGASGEDAVFYRSKLLTLEYYYSYELVKTGGLLRRLAQGTYPTVTMESALLV